MLIFVVLYLINDTVVTLQQKYFCKHSWTDVIGAGI